MAELTALDKSQNIATVKRLRGNNEPITTPVILIGAHGSSMSDDDLNNKNTLVLETDKLPTAEDLGEKLAALAEKFPNASLRSIGIFSDGSDVHEQTRKMHHGNEAYAYAEEFLKSVKQNYKPEYRIFADYDRDWDARTAVTKAAKLKNG